MGTFVRRTGVHTSIRPLSFQQCHRRGSAGPFSSSCKPLCPAGTLGNLARPCRRPLAVLALRNYSGHETPVSSHVVNEKGIVVC